MTLSVIPNISFQRIFYRSATDFQPKSKVSVENSQSSCSALFELNIINKIVHHNNVFYSHVMHYILCEMYNNLTTVLNDSYLLLI